MTIESPAPAIFNSTSGRVTRPRKMGKGAYPTLANEIRYRLRYNNRCLAVSMGEGHAPANADGVALHPVPAAAALHRSNFAPGRRACTGQSVKRAKPDARSDVLDRRRTRRAGR